ncbi:MAG TPA: DNA methyltransferase [Polyangiaceae bacterium]|jgi:hypothetical protein|nr:DNA methyltransferase [Polyangiaceae bacterium]
MNDADKRFHEQWLGMVQPAEGLVVSLPVLLDAQCVEKLPREAHVAFLGNLLSDRGKHRVADLSRLCAEVLELGAERFGDEAALPKELSLYVPEGRQLLRPTRALKWPKSPDATAPTVDATPASIAARPYAMLVWEVSAEVTSLDKPEAITGDWDYPAQAKFERLLRECRVPIGLLSNGWELRLVYAPHGESSGWIAFRVTDMASVSGRPIFDAFVMLLSRQRWFGVATEEQLPSLLAESRKRNADVTTELSHQVFEALEVLLAGFAAASDRDKTSLLRDALERDDEHLYAGLLTILLRLVFLLYCEDRALLPVEHPLFGSHYSLLGLFDQLQADHGRYPDTMHRRFGAYPRLVSLFRAVFLGVKQSDLDVPARRGELFDPNVYPFLEGWGPGGSAPITQPEERSAVVVPTVDDLTIHTVLQKLLYLNGQRLSYKALDVEQIGSVYEALMGFAVQRLETAAVRIRLGSKKGSSRVWLEAEKLFAIPPNQRASWLQDEIGFEKATATKIVETTASAKSAAAALTALEPLSGKRAETATAGTLIVQPGIERRRTSSHYTPRDLTEPIVARTLDPLIKAMGDVPVSDTLLNLVICDPAMGSGAFLVAACRYLADHVVAAWTREGKLEVIADAHEDVVNHARRLVAQRCLYGVDKNKYAVQLARLSLWLVTMARNEPFTFVDHALRHGDSLVGLSFEQIRAFHWKPGKQVELSTTLLKEALDEAIGIRQRIKELAAEGTWAAQREKERLLFDAEDALGRVRLVGDLVIGAFFSRAKDKDREKERARRLALVEQWLAAEKRSDEARVTELEGELRDLQAELKKTQVPFHWMVEFPEVFYEERPDPLDGGRTNGAAYVDGFIGNPPFLGGMRITTSFGDNYRDWLAATFDASSMTDICAYFFRRSFDLIGKNGAAGLVATNSIGQGDTRRFGLAHLRRSGGSIYSAETAMRWAGDASVTVSVVHFSVGSVSSSPILDGVPVAKITAFLAAVGTDDDPQPLSINAGIATIGNTLRGAGFLFDDENPDANALSEMRRLVANDPRNADRIFGYVAGEDVNRLPKLVPQRYAIDFEEMTEAQARGWPELFEIVEKKVKPARAGISQRDRRELWWIYVTRAPHARRYIAAHGRCLILSQLSPHLALSWVGSGVVCSHSIVLILLSSWSGFGLLQSRVHETWARQLSSSFHTDLRYTPSACFDSFPFPDAPDAVTPGIEHDGERLYEARAAYMLEQQCGLTQTYNSMKDSACEQPRVHELRTLHEELDRAVLAAYGWGDIEVPPYCPLTTAAAARVDAFENAVIDRLFKLNAQRAADEGAAAASTSTLPPKGRRATKGGSGGSAKATVGGGKVAQGALPGMSVEEDG